MSACVTALLCLGALIAASALAAEPIARGTAPNAARDHWAYQPIREPDLPAVADSDWPTSPIDRFILARLEAAGLSPSPPADRRTLIRRAYIDLIGLPPTYEQVESFVRDESPDAFEKVVDELLASPHYGERWGRHWLDVARYADTKDLVLAFGADRVRPYAYTYRDYVVRALNEDTPYDRFIHEQLAADRLDLDDEPWRLAAMGFLTLGRMFDNNLHDVYDDQIDTVTSGLLGLTVSCARCHDHKYDAIPAADYYSLYGIFAGSEAPIDLPLIEPPATPEAVAFEEALSVKRLEFQRFLDEQYDAILESARLRVTDYLMKIATQRPDPIEEAVFFLSLSPEALRPQIVVRWRRYLAHSDRADDPVFGPWRELLNLPTRDFNVAAKMVVERWLARPLGTAAGQINPLMHAALSAANINTRADVAELYGSLLVRAYEAFKSTEGVKDAALTQLLSPLVDEGGPIHFPKRSTFAYMSRVEADRYHASLREMDRLAAESPHAPPRAMVLTDGPEPVQPRIFLRGSPFQLGEAVPRRFLSVLDGQESSPFTDGSGRLELARAITAADNPLTSRVIVNRIWMHHFGEALVSTPGDFGNRSSPPTHPELLDHLAWTFQREGWSLKKLHRGILLSRVWQQASDDRPDCRRVDPYNRLVWRANRRRLDFESMRDTLLAVSGRLDPVIGGRPVDAAGDPDNRRRTIYGLVDRQSLPAVFRAFDFAVPDQTVPRRAQTTVPQQALFAMNSPFVIEQARALARHPAVAQETTTHGRIAAMYRRVLARAPLEEETVLAASFLERATHEAAADPPRHVTATDDLTPWEQLAQVLLMTNELMFVD